MNIASPLKMTKAQFYDFVQQQAEGRYEWEHGHIVQQMTGGTFSHSKLAMRFRDCLVRQLDPAKLEITVSDRGVETSRTIRYPDVVVEHEGADPKSLATLAPVLVVEVLSEASEKRDMRMKPEEYMSLPSLRTYIVASQDERECWVWQRETDGAFAVEPDHVVGGDARITIPTMAVEIPLAEIYRGMP